MWKYYSYFLPGPLYVGKGFTGTGNGHSLVESARGSTCISTQTDYVTYLRNVMNVSRICEKWFYFYVVVFSFMK